MTSVTIFHRNRLYRWPVLNLESLCLLLSLSLSTFLISLSPLSLSLTRSLVPYSPVPDQTHVQRLNPCSARSGPKVCLLTLASGGQASGDGTIAHSFSIIELTYLPPFLPVLHHSPLTQTHASRHFQMWRRCTSRSRFSTGLVLMANSLRFPRSRTELIHELDAKQAGNVELRISSS